MQPKKAVVLLSGGVDSTTTVALARQQGFDVHALTFRYGQRHETEIVAACRAEHAAKLDNMVFAELLKPYEPELKLWFDNFGPNNWGADADNTSALIGATSMDWGGGLDQERFTWAGGLGRISLALE